ncbi:MAG: AI-2E family transporter [Flavisolibacter sp.]
MRTLSLPFYVKLAFVLIILLCLGYIAIIGQRIFIPLLFSFLFAVLLLPLSNFLEKKFRFPRSASSIVSVLLFITALALIMYFMGLQLASLSDDWPLLKTQMNTLFHDSQGWIAKHLHIGMQKQLNYINNATDDLMNSGTTILGKTVLSLSSTLLFFIFIFLYTFFILFHRTLLVRFVTVAFSEQYAPVIAEIIGQIKMIIRSYIVGLFLEMAIVSIIGIVVFLLLGVKYAFLLGLIIGVFNVVPYVGIFSAILISVLVSFATSGPSPALYVAFCGIGIHLIDSNFIMPRVVGSHVKINPLFVVLGVVTGEMIWGIPGMFLALPYLAIIKVIFDRVDGLRPWGILLGEEERLPQKSKPLQRWMKKKPRPIRGKSD